MAITIPPTIEAIFNRPGRDWTPVEALQVKEWLFEDGPFYYLLHLCGLRLGSSGTEQDAEDAFGQFYTRRLDSVIFLYDPARERKKTFWNYLLMCLERDAIRYGEKLRKQAGIEISLDGTDAVEETGVEAEYLPPGLQPTALNEPEDTAMMRAMMQALQDCLEQLPGNHRQAFLLLLVEEISDKEAGEIMNALPGTVRVWAARARAALKKCLISGRMERMTKKRVRIDEKKTRQVMDHLNAEITLTSETAAHLSDAVIIGYVLETLGLPEQRSVLAHIEACEACASKLEAALRRQHLWQTPAGQNRLAELRRRLQPGPRQMLQAQFEQRLSRLQALQHQLEALFIRPGFLPQPGYLNAAMPAEAEGETPDQSLQWYYGPDENGNLVIRISSFILDYDGVSISLQAGAWQAEMLLEPVEPGQLGAELVVPAEEVAAYPFEEGIRFSLAV